MGFICKMEPVNGTKMQPFFTTIMHDMLSIALRELESWAVKHSMGEKHPGNLNNEFFVMNQALFFAYGMVSYRVEVGNATEK
jgi:hypothetical protein